VEIPKFHPSARLENSYAFQPGDVFALIDLGDGGFVLTPQVSSLATLGDRVSQIMEEEGITLEEMLKDLEQEREIYYREHYDDAKGKGVL
jgi:hypothetical protein